MMIDHAERMRRWKLALGDEEMAGLSEEDRRMGAALSALYDTEKNGKGSSGSGRKGGLGASSPKVSKWLGDIREFFPSQVVQVIQKDAFDRLDLKALMLEPEFLANLEADVHLVAEMVSLRRQMPPKVIETARAVIQKVVDELMKRLQTRTAETLKGALNKSVRTRRPKFNDIDWPKTIQANLKTYQPEYMTIIPETLIGYARKTTSKADLDHVLLCVDQSGSMLPSVVYSSIFAGVMGSLPAMKTTLVTFDTSIFDLTEELEDPVSVIFGIQLGGGTDINAAVKYCEEKIDAPAKSHFILISDLEEGGNRGMMLARIAAMKASGVNVVVLLALSDEGRPHYHEGNASAIAAMGCPVFACTPDQFPDMMATALNRGDIGDWASSQGIATIRAA